jgi:ubiquitin C-terminal hydrolase
MFGKSLKTLSNNDLGLKNKGNTCYANSALQLLRATTLLDNTDNTNNTELLDRINLLIDGYANNEIDVPDELLQCWYSIQTNDNIQRTIILKKKTKTYFFKIIIKYNNKNDKIIRKNK